MAWTWEFVLQVFRSLGGTAENVARKDGPRGRGLSAIDPEKPVRLLAPENLILPVSDVEIKDGRLKISDAASIGKTERTFLENYYEGFSWTDGERDEATAFLNGVDNLPAEVRDVLADEFGVSLAPDDTVDRAERWLLQKRLLGWRGQAVLAPFFDLVHHDPKAQPFAETDGMALAGKFPSEVRMLRRRLSPFAAFWKFGFASAERTAFSLPMTLQMEDGMSVTIAQNINANAILGDVPVPDFERDGDSVQFSCLMLGSSRNPKLSRGIFYRIMRDAGQTKPEQVFDNILHINRLSFLRLLEVLESREGGLIPELRKVVRLQLEAMSWCVGARDL
jgi:hypothetical protein